MDFRPPVYHSYFIGHETESLYYNIVSWVYHKQNI